MLKKYLYRIIFSLFIIINFFSCNSNPFSPEFYEDGSFYYYDKGKINLYPSKSIMLLKFNDDTSPNLAKKLLDDYNIEFYSEIYNYGISFDTLVSRNEIIVINLKGKNQTSSYITRYPKIHYSSPHFGNLPEVKYCLTSYSTDGSQNYSKRVFITEEIVFKVIDDSISIDYFLEKYRLRLIPNEYLGVNVYLCELTDYSTKDALKIANEIYNEPNIEFSHPSFIGFHWRE